MATLKELSEHTGYSITTISRVLNNDPTMSVSDATRAAILEAAGALNYKKPSPRQRRDAGEFPVVQDDHVLHQQFQQSRGDQTDAFFHIHGGIFALLPDGAEEIFLCERARCHVNSSLRIFTYYLLLTI